MFKNMVGIFRGGSFPDTNKNMPLFVSSQRQRETE